MSVPKRKIHQLLAYILISILASQISCAWVVHAQPQTTTPASSSIAPPVAQISNPQQNPDLTQHVQDLTARLSELEAEVRKANPDPTQINLNVTQVLQITSQAVADVAVGAGVVFGSSGGILLEHTMDTSVSLWSNIEFKNTWDYMRDASNFVGPIMMALGTFMITNTPDKPLGGQILLAAGGGGVGLFNLIGAVGGGKASDSVTKAEKLLEYAELSRQAFDDANARALAVNVTYGLANTLFKQVDTLKRQLVHIQQQVQTSVTYDKTLYSQLFSCLSSTINAIESFATVATFVHTYTQQLLDQYQMYQQAYPSLGIKFDAQKSAINNFLKDYKENIENDWLSELPSLKSQIIGFCSQLQVIINSAIQRHPTTPAN